MGNWGVSMNGCNATRQKGKWSEMSMKMCSHLQWSRTCLYMDPNLLLWFPGSWSLLGLGKNSPWGFSVRRRTCPPLSIVRWAVTRTSAEGYIVFAQ